MFMRGMSSLAWLWKVRDPWKSGMADFIHHSQQMPLGYARDGPVEETAVGEQSQGCEGISGFSES